MSEEKKETVKKEPTKKTTKKKESKGHNLPPKKTFQVVRSKTKPTLYMINYREGGAIPKELSGLYNKARIAWDAIERYQKEHRTYLDHVRDKEDAKKQDETGA